MLAITGISMVVAFVLLLFYWQLKRNVGKQLAQKELDFDHQQKMLQLALEAQENERKRVSKALHDEVGVLLQALHTTTFSLIRNASEEDKKEIQQLVDALTETVRRISWDLMPSSLERFGLAEAIDELCTRLSSREPATISFTTNGTAAPLDKNQEILLYRIVQEALNNALTHSKATHIQVLFNWRDTEFCIEVRDNGIGFEMPVKSNYDFNSYGLGLFTIKNRAGLLQGYVSFEKNLPTGTVLKFILPQSGHAKN